MTLEQPYQELVALLDGYARFGVDLGLERMVSLLADLGNPHQQVPILHIAGTNGKGSVCAYLSAILTAAGYRVGRYTSPHLVHWTERICLNEQPIETAELRSHLQQVHTVAQSLDPIPTQFEVLTAAAFSYFAAQTADLCVLEVGLGGRLDATNVCSDPLVSVIVSIGRDHWQRLGPTLTDIAGEKAGILKPGRPAVVGPLLPEADAVVRARAQTLGCPTTWVTPAISVGQELAYDAVRYPQILLGPHQRVNSAVAIATVRSLQSQGWSISDAAIRQGMAQVCWPGRLQWTTWQGQQLLIDGAHNAASAAALRTFVDQELKPPSPVSWLMGMLSTKDHEAIFAALLRPGDTLTLVPVPGHATADPQALAELAQQVCPELAAVSAHDSLNTGLAQVFSDPGCPILCGSLYLLGQFLETTQQR